MLLPLKAVILNKPRKDGNYVIYYQYCYSSDKRVLLSTDIAIPAQYWNKKRQCISKLLPKSFGNTDDLNTELLRLKKIIEAVIEYSKSIGESNIGDYVKQTFHPKLDISTLQGLSEAAPVHKREPDLFKEIEDYIQTKKKKVCAKGVCNYISLRDHLLAFQTFRKMPIKFTSFDYSFYIEFVEFLMYDYQLPRKKNPTFGLKITTIGRTIKQLRVFVKDRIKRKIIPYVSLDDFKIIDEDADAVYLTYAEIGRIHSLELSASSTLALYRDMFVFGCLTRLRFSDYSTLRYEDYRNGLLFKKTDKVNNWVAIPLRKEAAEIFEARFKNATPTISNVLFNRYIKEIAALAGIVQPITFSYKKGNKDIVISKPKAQWITTHTCRRSFCTNEFLQGTDISLIMKISGHKTMKDFYATCASAMKKRRIKYRRFG